MDYYTVSEYAAVTGKDVGNIRRMLIQGKLQGEKVGRQWLIPKDVVYPEDQRVKSGEYRNWRRKLSVKRNHPELMHTLEELSRRLGELYGDEIERVVLYGSYARGEQTEESDVDLAVILKQKDDEETHNAMTDLVVDFELELGVTLSVITIESAEYSRWNRILPFYKNLVKEGIVLWKMA